MEVLIFALFLRSYFEQNTPSSDFSRNKVCIILCHTIYREKNAYSQNHQKLR